MPADRAPELVAGFACFNDATLRDWQRHTPQFTPLNPGDVGFKCEPQVFMKPGDRIEVVIEGIGHLLNPGSDEVAG